VCDHSQSVNLGTSSGTVVAPSPCVLRAIVNLEETDTAALHRQAVVQGKPPLDRSTPTTLYVCDGRNGRGAPGARRGPADVQGSRPLTNPCQFLDKNRRGIGKSQSIWTDSKIETPNSRPGPQPPRCPVHSSGQPQRSHHDCSTRPCAVPKRESKPAITKWMPDGNAAVPSSSASK
jgi:hypothetical protein